MSDAAGSTPNERAYRCYREMLGVYAELPCYSDIGTAELSTLVVGETVQESVGHGDFRSSFRRADGRYEFSVLKPMPRLAGQELAVTWRGDAGSSVESDGGGREVAEAPTPEVFKKIDRILGGPFTLPLRMLYRGELGPAALREPIEDPQIMSMVLADESGSGAGGCGSEIVDLVVPELSGITLMVDAQTLKVHEASCSWNLGAHKQIQGVGDVLREKLEGDRGVVTIAQSERDAMLLEYPGLVLHEMRIRYEVAPEEPGTAPDAVDG